jgi:hypothetical protein
LDRITSAVEISKRWLDQLNKALCRSKFIIKQESLFGQSGISLNPGLRYRDLPDKAPLRLFAIKSELFGSDAPRRPRRYSDADRRNQAGDNRRQNGRPDERGPNHASAYSISKV